VTLEKFVYAVMNDLRQGSDPDGYTHVDHIIHLGFV